MASSIPNRLFTLRGAAAFLGISGRHLQRNLAELGIHKSHLEGSGRGQAGIYILNRDHVARVRERLKRSS